MVNNFIRKGVNLRGYQWLSIDFEITFFFSKRFFFFDAVKEKKNKRFFWRGEGSETRVIYRQRNGLRNYRAIFGRNFRNNFYLGTISGPWTNFYFSQISRPIFLLRQIFWTNFHLGRISRLNFSLAKFLDQFLLGQNFWTKF